MRLKTMVAVMALVGCCMTAKAQGMPQVKMDSEPMPTLVEPRDALNIMLTGFEEELTGVARKMPAEKYSFAPSAGTFAPAQGATFDGVRTFAQELTHLISANYYFYGVISGEKPDVDMKAINAMTAKDDLLKALAASFVFAHRAIRTITAGNAFVAIKGVDGMNTRATVAAFGVAHGYDHYGQMVEYLRMNGLVPPGSK